MEDDVEMRFFKNFSLSVLLCLGLGLGLGQNLIFAPAVEAWGGVGPYGMGGYGYGRLLRMGTRGAYGYGNRNRYNKNRYGQNGQFSYNHNRVNGLNGSQGAYGYGSNANGLYGRAQGRFQQRHSNNQLWNEGSRGAQGGQGNGGSNLWGSNSGSHPYYWGQSGAGQNQNSYSQVRGGYGYGQGYGGR